MSPELIPVAAAEAVRDWVQEGEEVTMFDHDGRLADRRANSGVAGRWKCEGKGKTLMNQMNTLSGHRLTYVVTAAISMAFTGIPRASAGLRTTGRL